MAKELPSLVLVLVVTLMISVGTGTAGTVFFQQGKTSYQFNIPDGETSDFADLQKDLDAAPSILKISSGLEDNKVELGKEDEVIQSVADSSTHPRGEGEEEGAALPIVGLSDHHPHPNQAYSPGEKFHARMAGKRKRLPLCRELRWPYTTSSNPVPCIPDNVDEAREKQRRFGRGGGDNNPNSYLYYESPRLLPRPISPAFGITPPRPRFLTPPPSPKFQANFIQNPSPAPRPQRLTWPSRPEYGRNEEGGSGGGWGSSPTPSPQSPQEEQGQGWSKPSPSSSPAQEEVPSGWSSSSSVPSSEQGYREQQQHPSSGWTEPQKPQQQQAQNGWSQPPQNFKQKPLRPSLLRNYQQPQPQQQTVGWSQQQQPEQQPQEWSSPPEQPQQGGWSQPQQPPPPHDTNNNNGWSQPQEQPPPQDTNTNGWSQPSQQEQSPTEPSQNGWSSPNQEQQQQPQQEGGQGWSSSSSSSGPDQQPPSPAPVDNSSGQRQGNWGRNYGYHQSPPQTFLPRQPPFDLTQTKPQYSSMDKAPLPISDRHPDYARELERYRKLVVVLLRRLHTQTTSGGPRLLPRPISPVQQSNGGGSGGTPLAQGSWYGGGYANEDNGVAQQPQQPPPPQEQQGGPSGGWQQPPGPQDNAEPQPQPSPPPSQSQLGWQQQQQGQGEPQPQPSPQLYSSNWRPSSSGRAIQFGHQQQTPQPQPPYLYGPAFTYGPPSPPTNPHNPQQPNLSYRSEGQPDQSSHAFVSQNYGVWPQPTNNYKPNVQYQHAATTETVPIIDTAGLGGSGDTDCDLGNCTATSESTNINNHQEINSVDAGDLNPTPGELAVILSATTSSPSNKELSALVIFPVVTPTSDKGSGGAKVDAILPTSGSGRVDKSGFDTPAEEDEAMLSVLRTMTIDELEVSLGISPDGKQ